ncbi:hypothetical protein Pfo_024436, partial [Paulownia fortunei]
DSTVEVEEGRQQPLNNNDNSSSSILVLHDALIVTMDSQNRVFRNGAVAVRGDTIIAVGQSQDIVSQFSSLSPQLVNLHGHFLLPGICVFNIFEFNIVTYNII